MIGRTERCSRSGPRKADKTLGLARRKSTISYRNSTLIHQGYILAIVEGEVCELSAFIHVCQSHERPSTWIAGTRPRGVYICPTGRCQPAVKMTDYGRVPKNGVSKYAHGNRVTEGYIYIQQILAADLPTRDDPNNLRSHHMPGCFTTQSKITPT